MTLTELYRAAFDVYGEVTQIIVGIEELSELQKELCKHYRGFDNIDKIAEETADALMVIFEQIECLGIHNAVSEKFKEKACRLAERLGISNFEYEPPEMLKCKLPDGIKIRIDGENDFDACRYRPIKGYRNVTVTHDVCQVCGHNEISWIAQEDTEEFDPNEEDEAE